MVITYTIDEILKYLQDEDAAIVAEMLHYLISNPTGNAQIAAVLEGYLTDKRLCIAELPASYAEVRWIAGVALCRERSKQGNFRPVVVRDTFNPISGITMKKMAEDAGIISAVPYHELVQKLETEGKILRITRVFHPA